VPTYDYVCTACGQEVEVVHSLHGHGPSACSVCGGAMKRSFAPPTVHFKGSGWARKEKPGRSPAGGKPRTEAGAGETAGAGEPRTGAAAGETAGAGETGGGSSSEKKPSGEGR
jgi:putative FmdB family regulatory protein